MVLCAVAGANYALAVFHSGSAHGAFKPLLYLNAAFLAAAMAAYVADRREEAAAGPWLGYVLAVVAVALVAHWGSLRVDLSFHDWNHIHITSGLKSAADFRQLFTRPQADGFYRPMSFVSLWLDTAVSGGAKLAYHVHSLVLAVLSAFAVAWLARLAGYGRGVAGWAAILYACVPSSFEPVIWPAARFDAEATFLLLLSICCALTYLKRGGAWIAGSGVFLVLALLNKESAYAVPVVVAAWAFLAPWFGYERAERGRAVRVLTVLGVVCAGMLAVRFAVFHGMGGYPAADGRNGQFAFGFKTIASLFTRLLPGAVALFNTTFPYPGWLRAMLSVLAVVALATAALARAGKRELFLLVLVFLSGLPVLNLVGWISPFAQNSRYVYMPACWVCIFLPAVVAGVRWRGVLLAGWVVGFASCLFADQMVYRRMLDGIPANVQKVARDAGGHGAVYLNIPEDPYGVYYYRLELVERLKGAGIAVSTDPNAPGATLRMGERPEDGLVWK